MSPFESWFLIASAAGAGMLAGYCLITAVDLMWPPQERR